MSKAKRDFEYLAEKDSLFKIFKNLPRTQSKGKLNIFFKKWLFNKRKQYNLFFRKKENEPLKLYISKLNKRNMEVGSVFLKNENKNKNEL